jgi:hypothetical protein
MSRSRIAVFVAGVQKGGTTSLHSYLSDHAQLAPPSRKELHVFDDEARDWARPDYGDIETWFEPASSARHRFESTPVYIYWPPALGRLAAYNPDARLILVFRDPFERAWSQWRMEYARGDEALPFAAAIRAEPQRLTSLAPLDRARRVQSYIDRGRYGQQLRCALALFPREQLLCLRSEDLREDHNAVLARIADFLSIAPFQPVAPRTEHRTPAIEAEAAPTEDDLAFIADSIGEDLDVFADLSGLDVSAWPTALHR